MTGGIPIPSPVVAVALASAVVHLQEFASTGGHDADRLAASSVLGHREVIEYLHELDALALLPKRRDDG